jgi:hypothetical protein
MLAVVLVVVVLADRLEVLVKAVVVQLQLLVVQTLEVVEVLV